MEYTDLKCQHCHAPIPVKQPRKDGKPGGNGFQAKKYCSRRCCYLANGLRHYHRTVKKNLVKREKRNADFKRIREQRRAEGRCTRCGMPVEINELSNCDLCNSRDAK